jgi:hypothetical protein
VQSLDADIRPEKSLSKLTATLNLKLIEPAARTLFISAQAKQIFGGKGADIKPSDQLVQRDMTFNLSLTQDSAKTEYSRKLNLTRGHASVTARNTGCSIET